MERRAFLQGVCATPLLASAGAMAGHPDPSDDSAPTMYGLISNMKATAGDRDRLIRILIDGTQAMPGCRQYVVSADAGDDHGLWITEVWDSEAAHRASLQRPAVQAAIAEGRPLIAGMGARHVVNPVGGTGIG